MNNWAFWEGLETPDAAFSKVYIYFSDVYVQFLKSLSITFRMPKNHHIFQADAERNQLKKSSKYSEWLGIWSCGYQFLFDLWLDSSNSRNLKFSDAFSLQLLACEVLKSCAIGYITNLLKLL